MRVASTERARADALRAERDALAFLDKARAQAALARHDTSSLSLLLEQAATPPVLDACLRAAGFRMGPCELMDLIGHDTNFSVTQSVFNAYFGDPRFTPSVLQQEMVNAGYLGRKSGRGFYDYSGPEPAPTR